MLLRRWLLAEITIISFIHGIVCETSKRCAPSSSSLLQIHNGENRNATLFAANHPTEKKVHQGTGPKWINIATTTKHRDFVPKDVNDPIQYDACYDLNKNFLKRRANLSLISRVWKSVCSEIERRNKLHKIKDGCLYLPTDDHMKLIDKCVEHPNPWQYIYLLEDLLFERGDQDSCPSVAGVGAIESFGGNTFTACDDQEGFQGSNGCIAATFVGDFSPLSLKIYKLDGLMGIDPTWAAMIQECLERFHLDENGYPLIDDARRAPSTLAYHRRVTIPLKFVVCKASNSSIVEVTDEQISLSLDALNRGFSGMDICTTERSGADGGEAGTEFEAYDTQKANMGIQFSLDSTERVVNSLCSFSAFENRAALGREFPHPDGKITVLFVDINLLGFASFPFPPECDERFPVVVRWDAVPKGCALGQCDRAYVEGHTLTHEMGHHLGLLHTFGQGMCSPGDGVDDTNAERFSNLENGCPASRAQLPRSCGNSDPVHNFMDYSEDRCMCSFTQGQKDKVWDAIEKCEPTIFGMSQIVPAPPTPPPTPCEDTPNWDNGGGDGCDVYRNNGWCKNGVFYGIGSVPSLHNLPDENCCGCGKGQTKVSAGASSVLSGLDNSVYNHLMSSSQ